MTPTVVAHRVNSVAEIEVACGLGADAVEIDVRVTRDGRLVLGHDAVQRPGRLRRPYVISWSRRRSLPLLTGLEEAVEAALSAGADVKLDVKDGNTLPAVAAWCNENTDLNRVAVWCRSADQIAELTVPFGEVALLSNDADASAYVAAAIASGADAVSLHPRATTEQAVALAHDTGLTVYAWILDASRQPAAAQLGVDGLVTDWVAQARALGDAS